MRGLGAETVRERRAPHSESGRSITQSPAQWVSHIPRQRGSISMPTSCIDPDSPCRAARSFTEATPRGARPPGRCRVGTQPAESKSGCAQRPLTSEHRSGRKRCPPPVHARHRRKLVERGHPRASDSPASRDSDSRQLRAWASDPADRSGWASEQTSQMHATPLHLVVLAMKARDAGMSVRRLARPEGFEPPTC